jgi:hypothetical protein
MELQRLQFGYKDNSMYHTIEATHPDHEFPVGQIDWVKSNKKAAKAADMEPGEVAGVWAQPMRQGIGTALWNEAKKRDPNIKHSSSQTSKGAAWAKKVGD